MAIKITKVPPCYSVIQGGNFQYTDLKRQINIEQQRVYEVDQQKQQTKDEVVSRRKLKEKLDNSK